MGIRENLYRMSLVGALAGLVAWATGPPVMALFGLRTVRQELYWVAEILDLLLIGLWIGALCIGFAGYWSDGKVKVWRTLAGATCGCLAGALSGLLFHLIRQRWLEGQHTWQVSVLAWALTGASLGLIIGWLRYRFLWGRVMLSFLGGTAGAAAGGWVAHSLGEPLPYVTHAFGLMVTGCGVAFCSTAAVVVMRAAQLKFVHSADPDVAYYFAGRRQEWDLHRGDELLLGSAAPPPGSRQYQHVPDHEMAERHAEIYESSGAFYVRPHNTNKSPNGSLYPLSLKRSEGGREADVGEAVPLAVGEAVRLEDSDEILMGSTKFRFSLRGRDGFNAARRRNGFKNGLITATAVGWLALLSCPPLGAQTPAAHGQAQFTLADKVRLYQCSPGSERPCFSVTVNVVDRNADVLQIPVLSPQQAVRQTQVLEGGTPLEVVHVAHGFDGGRPRRFAVLLVDVSGSMLEPAAAGVTRGDAVRNAQTKFDVMRRACARFAEDFAEDVDQVAIIPFASRKVVRGVETAGVCDTRRCLDDEIKHLAAPTADANTGLYSAVQAAVARIRLEREKAAEAGYPNAQSLLVVMTDGMNHVGNRNDDPGLLQDLRPVRDLIAGAALPIITIGFGSGENIDEEALRQLAWPTRSNYIPARNAGELLDAFKKARALQLQRMQITFLPRQTLRGQLVNPHEYTVRFVNDRWGAIEGTFKWAPSGLVAPPFEGTLPPEARRGLDAAAEVTRLWLFTYLITLALFGTLIYLLWTKVPPLIWADERDAQVLRQRALALRGRRLGDGGH